MYGEPRFLKLPMERDKALAVTTTKSKAINPAVEASLAQRLPQNEQTDHYPMEGSRGRSLRRESEERSRRSGES